MILSEIIEVSGVEKAVITSQRERSAKDLEMNHRLMTSKLRWDGAHRARVREVCLTKKGLAYITRTGEYINSDW